MIFPFLFPLLKVASNMKPDLFIWLQDLRPIHNLHLFCFQIYSPCLSKL